ncbi:MAG: hypothetical protein ACIAS6_01720 [Phycisphaerales bacterium JB060]
MPADPLGNLFEYHKTPDPGPMPVSISHALGRRRRAIRSRRIASAAAIVLVVALAAWFALPQASLVTSEGPVAGHDNGNIPKHTPEHVPVRFAPSSVLALRMADPEGRAPPAAGRSQAGRDTVFGLRQRELGGLAGPAS